MTESSWAEIVRLVEARAGGCCEYCRMHQDLQGATFHVEHIIPSSAKGSDNPDNLAWAGCDLHKSNRQQLPDPETGAAVPLFNPRQHVWSDHLHWNGHLLVGRTPIGRALVAAFDLNSTRRQRIRQAEESFDLVPPDAEQE